MRLVTIRTTDGRTRAVRVDAEDDDLGQAALVSPPVASDPLARRTHPAAKPRPPSGAHNY